MTSKAFFATVGLVAVAYVAGGVQLPTGTDDLPRPIPVEAAADARLPEFIEDNFTHVSCDDEGLDAVCRSPGAELADGLLRLTSYASALGGSCRVTFHDEGVAAYGEKITHVLVHCSTGSALVPVDRLAVATR